MIKLAKAAILYADIVINNVLIIASNTFLIVIANLTVL